jgi:hypothetical protein
LKGILAVSIAVLVLAGGVVLALWWAGFAPFPTEPVLLASYQNDMPCNVTGNNWTDCTPKLSNPYPQGSMGKFRLFPGGKKDGYGQYNQWGVEGFNGCWDGGCSDSWHEDYSSLQWKIYYDTEVPHFGLGKPKWLVILYSRVGKPLDGGFAETAFTTYSACMYRKPPDPNDSFYECKPIEPGAPWKVGAIHN